MIGSRFSRQFLSNDMRGIADKCLSHLDVLDVKYDFELLDIFSVLSFIKDRSDVRSARLAD